MKRKIYLEGELAEKYGKVLVGDVNSFRDAFRLLDANYPDFKNYLVECHTKGVGFILDVGDKNIEKDEDIILPVAEGDMVITAVPAGAKSGIGKIIAAIAIIVATVFIVTTFGPGAGMNFAQAFMALGTTAQVATLAAMSLGMSLAMAGIQQLMAPDPSVDSGAPQAYLFNGSESNIVEGDPVPVLYGQLQVPGRPISVAVTSNSNTYSSAWGNYGTPGTGNNSNYHTGSDIYGNVSMKQD